MDRNTIIGFVLIAVILFGFGFLNRPNKEEMARQQRERDSITLVNKVRMEQEIVHQKALEQYADTASKPAQTVSTDEYGVFSVSAEGEEKLFSVENEVLKLTFSNKGGRIVSAELKNYLAQDSLPLLLFDGDESSLDFTFKTNNERVINTSKLYFEKVSEPLTDADGNTKVTLRLKTDETAWMDFVYTLPKDDYMLQFSILSNGMNSVMPSNTNVLYMRWTAKMRQQEKGRNFENRYTSLYYKFAADDVEHLSESKNDDKRISNKLKWLAFKGQFFSSVFIAEDFFISERLTSVVQPEISKYLKEYTADMAVNFDLTGKNPTNFKLYFGPNHYKTLSAYDKDLSKDNKLNLRKLVPLGWGIFGWINMYAIIPMFNLFGRFIGSFGIIILLMTIVIKMVLLPLTYKSYISSAKMRVLKPEIDQINEKIPADKPTERQKATMELYKKVGVSPMSGCIPMLLQMPIFIALFQFFPAAIELRQQSFLWASDLSSYDSILKLPFTVPLGYGNHVSLFTLLMAVVTIISQKLNGNQMATNQPGGNMMKWMMYLMPIMFMFWFNNYASGLTYYYFVSTLITIIQTYIIRATVDDKKILAQLNAVRNNKSKNATTAKKKTTFMERLEKMQREQEKAMREKNKKRR